eukprot:8114776-Pyramimonas_sp.AAC.1
MQEHPSQQTPTDDILDPGQRQLFQYWKDMRGQCSEPQQAAAVAAAAAAGPVGRDPGTPAAAAAAPPASAGEP